MPEPLVAKGSKVLSWKDIKGPTLMPDSIGVAGGTEDAQNNAGADTQLVAGADTLPDSETCVLRFQNNKMNGAQVETMMRQMAKMAADAATKKVSTEIERGVANNKNQATADFREQF